MSKSCGSCGSPLPDSHRHSVCSMCYGDIDYGTDGYARAWYEEQERQQQEAEPEPWESNQEEEQEEEV